MEYDVVIGLEVHAELKTQSKCFCSCKNVALAAPNTQCCPVCIGMPGALPVLNKQAVEYTIKAGLATNCTINNIAIFERKNYFYPDLAKAYQISQLEKPICINGYLEVGGQKVRINRIHLEEDAGKLIHNGDKTLVDYNRGGVPLIELVTEPDITSAKQAVEFIEKLRLRYIFAGIAECKMQEGQMRADVNISLKPHGSSTLGVRTEMKNLTGLKAIERAIDYEIDRQKSVLESGGAILQQTLRWDDDLGENYPLRSKENSNDYRYFSDPDLPVVEITNEQINAIRKTMPKMPEELFEIYTKEFGLSKYDASVLLSDAEIASFYQKCIKLFKSPKNICNWITTEVMAKTKESDGKILVSVENFVWIVKAVGEGKIQRQSGKVLLGKIWGTSESSEQVAKAAGYICDITSSQLNQFVEDVIKANPAVVEQYKQKGDPKVINFLVGGVMKASRGKANAAEVGKMIAEMLNK